jgi:dienelactone hydrolase
MLGADPQQEPAVAAEPSVLTARELVLPNGDAGRPLSIDTANPRNYHQVINAPDAMPRVTIDARLFVPQNASKALPIVIVVPGSLGVAPSHLRHAQSFVELGYAACVIDPFGRRGVTSTVSNQAQYSFAASAYDVLMAVRTLSREAAIDAKRIGAQGHSRGGSAVLTAAMRRFSAPVLGESLALHSIYAAYPWCGHQFDDPDVGSTVVRAVIGDRDDWCLPQCAQGHIQAIHLRGGRATLRIFEGAGHSFERGTAIEMLADAAVSPDSPITFITNDGAMVHPATGHADPAMVDYDTFVYALKAGYGRRGAKIGSQGNDAEAFRADMIEFWSTRMTEGSR